MNAKDLIKKLYLKNPTERFATNAKGNAIAYWCDTKNLWVVVLGLLINNTWDRMPALLVNGQPMFTQEDWIEVPKD
jgi:hypothetical protein